jgi:hypothetical protein
MNRYLIIVSRDRPDLLGTLAVIYGQKGVAEIRFDQRQGRPWTGTGARPDRRTLSPRDGGLPEYGFLVILQPTLSAQRAEAGVGIGAHGHRPHGARRVLGPDGPVSHQPQPDQAPHLTYPDPA